MKKYLLSIFGLFIIASSFLCKAQTPILWGLSYEGGPNKLGTIFNYNVTTGNYLDVFNFDSSNGSLPENSLIQADNGLLYGMTYQGGAYNWGTIFSFDISTGIETDLHDFNDDIYDGANPTGSLIQASNGLLYGMTSHGGNHGDIGTIFSYNILTGKEIILYDFGNITNDGESPYGSLIQIGDSLLCGVTKYGGVDSVGIIFSYNINSSSYSDIHDFGYGTDGAFPCGSLIQADNGLLYGMTTGGGNDGTYGGGTIFSYNILTGKENQLLSFGGSTNGLNPQASLIQATDSLLYGMTYDGGTYSDIFGTLGIIFSYNITTGKEVILHNFGNGTDGGNPYGSLIQASNGLLYGTTPVDQINSTFGYGTIFNFNISTNAEADIYYFDSTEGAPYIGNLIEVDTPIFTGTGIKQLSVNVNQFSIYPNPTSGQFTIELNGNQNGYTIEIYNVLGEKVYESVLNNSQNIINLSGRADGMYFVYLKSDEGVEVGKVMVTK